MKIAVMGTGALGGYFGGRLAEAGEDVTFIARGAQLAALRESGLSIQSPRGNLKLQPARATDDAPSMTRVRRWRNGRRDWPCTATMDAHTSGRSYTPRSSQWTLLI